VGLAFAELAASRGAHVALIARDLARLEAAREAAVAARRDSAQRIEAYSCDLARWDEVTETIARIVEDLGPVDVLANCAGFCFPARFAEASMEEIRSHIDVNLLGTMHTARAVVPSMIERGRGHIANVSSMGGFVGVYGYSGYSPSKFGVIGFSEVLRCELKPHGIGVSVLCPPNIDTPGYARELATEPPETAKINGATRAASPKSMAEALLRAIESNRYLIVPGLVNGLLYRLKGLWPELFFAVFDRDVASVRAQASKESKNTP
jgi:short-subunit dehydrogenase